MSERIGAVERWPAWLFRAREGPTDYLCEFDHPDLERARASILWHGRWRRQTSQVLAVMDAYGVLRDGLRVLDYGCGVGRVALPLLRRHQLKVQAVDRSPCMRRHAADALAEFVAAGRAVVTSDDDLLRAPPAEPFDLVLLIEVAQHIPEPELDRVLPALRRLLAPGGRMFIYGNLRLDVDACGMIDMAPVRDVIARHLEIVREDTWPFEPQTRYSLLCEP